MFKKLGKKTKALGVVAGSTVVATTSQAAVDLTDVQTKMTEGSAQLESFAPIVIGFVLVLIVIGAIIGLTKKGK